MVGRRTPSGRSSARARSRRSASDRSCPTGGRAVAYPRPMSGPIVIVGSPTSLGGHFGGMERTPAELRRLELLERLRDRPGLAAATFVDRGDAGNDPGWAPDDDPRAKNRARICAYLPRLAAHVASALALRARWCPGPRARRRLHDPRRGARRDPSRAARRPARARLVRRTRRLQHARHDALGQRLGDALRDDLRPRRARPARRLRRADRPRGGRRPARRPGPRRDGVADAGRVAGRPFRRGDARDRRRPGRPRGLGAHGRRVGSTGSTSRSTWTRSTPRAAGRSRCPSLAAWRSTQRSRRSGRSRKPARSWDSAPRRCCSAGAETRNEPRTPWPLSPRPRSGPELPRPVDSRSRPPSGAPPAGASSG